MLEEAATAGYKSIELGPWSYLPTRADELSAALNKQGLSLVAGTIFDDLVSEENFANIVALTHNICRNLSQVPSAEKTPGNLFQPPYLVIIDFGNPLRAKYAGHSELAPRLSPADWQRMIGHIITISQLAWQEYGVRPVIHPHAGGCIEFADEIDLLAAQIPMMLPDCVSTPAISSIRVWTPSAGWIAILNALTTCTLKMSIRRYSGA